MRSAACPRPAAPPTSHRRPAGRCRDAGASVGEEDEAVLPQGCLAAVEYLIVPVPDVRVEGDASLQDQVGILAPLDELVRPAVAAPLAVLLALHLAVEA